MDTKKFCTYTRLLRSTSPSIPGIKLCAVDIGYSGVKCYSDTNVACFQSYARPFDASHILSAGTGAPDKPGADMDTPIFYRDEDNNVWSVGNSAVSELSVRDTSDSENTLYSRDRYDTPLFKVLSRVGLALCMWDTHGFNSVDVPLYLQTGLPPAFRRQDTADLKRVLSGTHSFSIKLGNERWREFSFTLPKENIQVMDQPQGTLFSVLLDKELELDPVEGSRLLNQNVLICDPGFGTFDTFHLRGRKVLSHESFPKMGMQSVYAQLAEMIQEEYGEQVTIHAMPKVLEDGFVRVFSKRQRSLTPMPVDDMLARAVEKVGNEAFDKIDVAYDYLRDMDMLIYTGGTSEVWEPLLKQRFSGYDCLALVPGNNNDQALGLRYANVRGYYGYLYNRLREAGPA